jgi:hypothetical protein
MSQLCYVERSILHIYISITWIWISSPNAPDLKSRRSHKAARDLNGSDKSAARRQKKTPFFRTPRSSRARRL